MTAKVKYATEHSVLFFLILVLGGLFALHVTHSHKKIETENIEIVKFSEKYPIKTIHEIPQNTNVVCTSGIKIEKYNCESCSWWLKGKQGKCAYVVMEK